jgi:hypothetical protein
LWWRGEARISARAVKSKLFQKIQADWAWLWSAYAAMQRIVDGKPHDLVMPAVGREHERKGSRMLFAYCPATKPADALGRKAANPALHVSCLLVALAHCSGAEGAIHLKSFTACAGKRIGEVKIAP